MVSNQVLGARAIASLSLVLAIAGCSVFRHKEPTEATPAATASTAAAPAEAQASAAPSDMTATEAAIAANHAAGPAPASSDADTRGIVNPNAPLHYTVKRGDTLWGIATMYLKDPWLWPEVWIINPQVANPHLIYPGDTLALAYGADGRPHVSLEQAGVLRLDPRLRSTPLENAIPTIPYSAIAAFLSRPTVMTKEQIQDAPYVLAFRDMHQVAGTNNEIYVRNLSAAENARYSVMHIGTELRDPDDGNRVVGYEAIYAATALVQRPGNPAKALLIDPARETLRGDRLLQSDADVPANFTPHAPPGQVHGRIIDVVGGVELVGQYEVAVINQGKSSGVGPGTVLAVDQAGDVVLDMFRGGRNIGNTTDVTFAPKVRLPDERSGTLLVFKSFDRVSYALVVGANNIIRVGDVVRNP